MSWEPLRVALAWRLAAGHETFIRRTRADHLFDAPIVLAGGLAEELVATGCVKKSPFHRASLGVFDHCQGPLGGLAAEFANSCLERSQELQLLELPEEWRQPGAVDEAKVFRYSDLRDYLEKRVAEAWVGIRQGIADGKIKARGAPIDRDCEGPAGEIPPSAVTETTVIGRSDGLLHQGTSSSRAWRSVSVFWPDVLRSFAPTQPNQPTDQLINFGQCTTQIEAVRRACAIVFPNGVPPGVTVKDRNAQIGDLIKKGGRRRPGVRTFQRAFQDGKARRKKRRPN